MNNNNSFNKNNNNDLNAFTDESVTYVDTGYSSEEGPSEIIQDSNNNNNNNNKQRRTRRGQSDTVARVMIDDANNWMTPGKYYVKFVCCY